MFEKSNSELSARRYIYTKVRVYWAFFGKRYFSITEPSWNERYILYFISVLKVFKTQWCSVSVLIKFEKIVIEQLSTFIKFRIFAMLQHAPAIVLSHSNERMEWIGDMTGAYWSMLEHAKRTNLFSTYYGYSSTRTLCKRFEAFLIGQFVKFFFLIGPSNKHSKAFVARLWSQPTSVEIKTHGHVKVKSHDFLNDKNARMHVFMHAAMLALIHTVWKINIW